MNLLNKIYYYVENEDATGLKNEIINAYEKIFQVAPENPDIARSLYHDISIFMQEEFVHLLKKKYKMKVILEAFSNIDKKNKPKNSIESLYSIIKEFVNKHDSLRFEGKPLWEL